MGSKDSTEIKLSLLENSHAFLREAVAHAVSAEADARNWQFAIVNLVQSLELSLKSLLFKIHPILIYDNVDKPKHTVGPAQALERLSNIGSSRMTLSEGERSRIEKAIGLRNEMTHSDFVLRPQYATAKFFEVFAFVAHFQARHFGAEVEEIVREESLMKLLDIKRAIAELAQKAKARMAEEAIEDEFVWACPNCQNDSFVIQNAIDTCYTCRYSQQTIECRRCERYFFEWELEDFAVEFETSSEEGRDIVRNNYGYDYSRACPDCTAKIKEHIAEQREDDMGHWEMLAQCDT